MTNTTDNVEAVARALCQHDGLDPDLDYSGPDDRWLPNWHEYRDFARAAIAALTVQPVDGTAEVQQAPPSTVDLHIEEDGA